MDPHAEDVPVLVVGAGPSGLSMGLFLNWHGIPAIVIERHDGYTDAPSAFGLTARTMEVFRSAALDGVVRGVAWTSGLSHLRGILGVQCLAGDEGRWLLPPDVPIFDPSAISPTGGLYCPQKLYDEALAEESVRRRVDLRFGTELYDFEQDATGVTAWIGPRGGAQRRIVRASFLVAADGARSRIRERLGIRRDHEQGGVQAAVTITFRADLTAAVAGRTFFLAAVNNEAYRGILTRRNDRGEWAAGFGYDPRRHGDGRFDEAQCTALVRAAVGDPHLPIEIVSVSRWSAEMHVAERFREQRVFLAGDAAHRMPPTGGFGGNVGIQDAHNLSWKLAAVLHGWAREPLLDSYEMERRPVAWETAKQALARMAMEAMRIDDGPREPLRDDLLIALGYRYTSSAILGPAYPSALPERLELIAEPGHRAPHVTIEQRDRQVSVLDLFGETFVLLTGPNGDPWITAAWAAAAELGCPIECLHVDELSKAYQLSIGAAILVRPDGFIAWRTDSVADARAALSNALRQILGISDERKEMGIG